jgi:hypothetical protein
MQQPLTRPNPHPPRTNAAGALFFAAALAVFGCMTSMGCAGAKKSTPKPLPPLQPTAGTIVGSALSFDFRALGTVASDGVTLPLLSPNGSHIAVQTGAAPDLPTALARPGQRAPLASRIAMYRLEARGIVRLGETDGGLVLGRSADNRGFLVESVRPDGARWIGKVDWSTRETEWLVQDGRVNAFASLGGDGTLTYSSREIRERYFDLVVRKDGQTRRLAGDGTRSYLMACMNADGSRVFAVSLRDGILELASADPTSDESLRQSVVRAFVTDRGNDELALFMTSAQGVRDGIDGRDWILFHRSMNSLARWNDVDGLRVVPGGVMAWARVDGAREAVLVGGKVRVRSTATDAPNGGLDPGTVVIEQLGVPRALGTIEEQPAIIIFAPEANSVRVLMVRILAK